MRPDTSGVARPALIGTTTPPGPPPRYRLRWFGVSDVAARQFTCGHCGFSVAPMKGWAAGRSEDVNNVAIAWIYVCHNCSRPTFIDNDKTQLPGVAFGDVVRDISDDSVRLLYEEARRATGATAYTAAVLCCRKLLMHIAVAKGADAGASFLEYVKFLGDKHFIPPGAIGWVDHIRQQGNEANHEIVMKTKEDAEELISFCEMLLKVIYEFPAAVTKRLTPPASP